MMSNEPTETVHKAGDLMPNGEIYLCRLDDEIYLVAPQSPKYMNWDDGMQYAADNGLELPDRHIAFLMYLRKNEGAFKGTYNETGSFPDSTFWSARRYGDNSAYYQWVSDGDQNLGSRSYELVVRPVRRFKSFSDLVIRGGSV